MPACQAASMSSSARSSVSPAPKNSGAEPIPPKLPHPSAILETLRAGGPGAAPVVTRGIQSNRAETRQPCSGPRRDSLMMLKLINPYRPEYLPVARAASFGEHRPADAVVGVEARPSPVT